MTENWRTQHNDHDSFEPEHVAKFLRENGTGTDNQGRHKLAQILGEYITKKGEVSVVDAACGTAVNWEVFRSYGLNCQYTGLDRTDQFIEHARNLYGDEINLVQGFVQEMPFEDDEHDVVILRHIVEHLADGYENAVREALRVAEKEVILVFFTPLIHSEEDDIRLCEGDNGPYYWNSYSHPKFIKFLTGLGYRFKMERVITEGAAASDIIVRIIK